MPVPSSFTITRRTATLLALLVLLLTSAAAALAYSLTAEANIQPAPVLDPAQRERLWTPEWAFAARSEIDPSGDGAVAVTLTSLRQPRENWTLYGSLPIEIAAVAWAPDWPDSLNLSRGEQGLVSAVNARLQVEPSIAFTRASLSRHGDVVELSIPAALNATTVIVHAPKTSDLLFIAWPSGRAFHYNEHAQDWEWITGRVPAILAHPPGGA